MDATRIKNIALRAIPIVLLAVFITLPLYEFFGFLTELDFSLYSEKLISILQTVVAVGSVVAVFIFKPRLDFWGRLCILLAFPLSIANIYTFVDGEWGGAIIFAIISSGCVFAIYLKFLPDSAYKAISAIVSVLLTIAIGILFVWNLIAGALSERTLDKKYESLNSTFVAEIYIEESLISTKTVLIVKPSQPEIGAFFGSYSAEEMVIFEGEEYAAQTLTVDWLDDETVIVNGEAYRINIE